MATEPTREELIALIEAKGYPIKVAHNSKPSTILKKIKEYEATAAEEPAEEVLEPEVVAIPEGVKPCKGYYIWEGAKECRTCRDHVECKKVSKK